MATHDLPGSANVVIIGGGVIGCSIAYHLAAAGVRDVLLLERRQLTCGTTWHAAGLVGQLRATRNLTQLAQYTTDLYKGLEALTGQAIGFKQNGSVSIASNAERFEELKRGASMAKRFGLEVEVIGPDEIKRLWPLVDTGDLAGGVFLPADGQTNPIDTARAMAIAARDKGATVRENIRVTGLDVRDGQIHGVRTEAGDVQADVVVNAAGMWAREVGQWAGVCVPLHAAEHFYIVTEPMAELPGNLPVLRDPDGCAYYKEDAGKLLVGAFEPVAKPWGMNGIPDDFCFDQLPEDVEHFEPVLEGALARVPALANAGIQTFFNGPESFTPDDRYLLGESPEVRGFYIAAGFNSIGIQSAGGAGKVLAEWIVAGHPPMDVWDVDVRRMQPFQRNGRYLHDRTVETLGLLYAMHWPFYQNTTARGVRRTPLHDRLASAGACFGELSGWERANWFARDGMPAEYAYSYGRQNWFPCNAAEHRAVREAVGLFDQTSFAEFLVQGADACSELNRIAANNVDVPPGRIVYTQWLNERGGIEADLTITRLAPDRYLVVTAAGTQRRDLGWLHKHINPDAHAVVTDITSAEAVVSIMGPRSRELLQSLTPDDLSDAAFPFASVREIELGYALVRAARITYVGELGYELYMPTEFATGVYDVIVAAGAEFGLEHAGFHALNSLRQEKGYRHFGDDIGDEDSPIEAGLSFAVAWDKPGGFIGRDALLAQREHGVHRRLVQFTLDDPEPLLYHDEPIWRDGEMVGEITSGMYGHTLGRAVGMGYVESAGRISADWIKAGRYEIEIAGERVPATASLRGFYDPANERIRG